MRKNISIKCENIQEGLIKKIGVKEFAILIQIVSLANEFNVSSVSQREIAELSGLSLPTVNKSINKLLNIKIAQSTILKRKFSDESINRGISMYLINTEIVNIF